MLIIPAIDLIDGACVRLRQGDYDDKTVFSDAPVAVARTWADSGATWLHVVDLDGAKAGRPMNFGVYAISLGSKAVDVRIELGGGIRRDDDVRAALDAGVERVIVGTAALEDPDGFAALCAAFPARIALGLDARDGRAKSERRRNGWRNGNGGRNGARAPNGHAVSAR